MDWRPDAELLLLGAFDPGREGKLAYHPVFQLSCGKTPCCTGVDATAYTCRFWSCGYRKPQIRYIHFLAWIKALDR